MLVSLARAISRHPVLTLLAWVVATVATLTLAVVGVGGGNLFDRTSTGVPTVVGADSTFVLDQQIVNAPTDVGPPLFIELNDVDPAAADVGAAVARLAGTLALRDGVVSVSHPYQAVPGVPADVPAQAVLQHPLVGSDGTRVLISLEYAPFGDASAEAEHHAVAEIAEETLAEVGQVRVYSDPLLFEDFSDQLERDLILGEAIALPVALLVMVLVFGGFLAASAPVIGAVASIAGGFAVLFGATYLLDVEQSAINVVTVLAIGLSVDYGLLVVSRYREELAGAREVPDEARRAEALATTLTTAGRTVMFSALTVAISVAGMVIFTAEIIRSIGVASLGAVLMALLTALTLVPATLVLYGRRLAARPALARVGALRALLARTADVSTEDGAFSRLAARVQRRPWLVLTACVVILGVLAAPITGLSVRNSNAELLPAENESRQFLAEYAEQYPAFAEPDIDVVADAEPAELQAWLSGLDSLEGVESVVAPYPLGEYAAAGIMTSYEDQGSADATALLRELRDLDAPFDVYLGGQAAIQVDFIDSLLDGAPLAAGLVVAATFVLLFLMTGSLLVPIKTLVINSASLAATVGVVTWIFADGNLEGLLDFTSTGGIETYVLVMILAFGFGLSMDYEVFLIARIKELVDRRVPNDEAVRLGLQRSGRIITSAALIIVLVFLGFAFGQILVIKQVGIGLAFAVALDATLVRMVLVPATMTLLGDWNWWAPAPLRRLHARYSLSH